MRSIRRRLLVAPVLVAVPALGVRTESRSPPAARPRRSRSLPSRPARPPPRGARVVTVSHQEPTLPGPRPLPEADQPLTIPVPSIPVPSGPMPPITVPSMPSPAIQVPPSPESSDHHPHHHHHHPHHRHPHHHPHHSPTMVAVDCGKDRDCEKDKAVLFSQLERTRCEVGQLSSERATLLGEKASLSSCRLTELTGKLAACEGQVQTLGSKNEWAAAELQKLTCERNALSAKLDHLCQSINSLQDKLVQKECQLTICQEQLKWVTQQQAQSQQMQLTQPALGREGLQAEGGADRVGPAADDRGVPGDGGEGVLPAGLSARLPAARADHHGPVQDDPPERAEQSDHPVPRRAGVPRAPRRPRPRPCP